MICIDIQEEDKKHSEIKYNINRSLRSKKSVCI